MNLFSDQSITQRESMKKKRRNLGKDVCGISHEMVMEIAMRLPAKSLMRFKCVSKQWASFISCRYFTNSFYSITPQQERLYMSLVAKGKQQRVLLSLLSSTTSPKNFVVDKELSIPGTGGYFLNGVRGLLCFYEGEKACIYNPTTRQLLTLPAIQSDIAEQDQKKKFRYYLGHDLVNDQYKLLCTISVSSKLNNLKSEHWVLTLEAGGSWKKVVGMENYDPHIPVSLGRSIITGSVLNYMARLDTQTGAEHSTCAVVSFDFRSEELTTIRIPEEVGDIPLVDLVMKVSMVAYGGKLAVFHLNDRGLVNLWVLDNTVWLNKSLVLQPRQTQILDTNLIVRDTTQDGKVILAPFDMPSQFYIMCYDVQRNDLRRLNIEGEHIQFDKNFRFDLRLMNESESIILLDF